MTDDAMLDWHEGFAIFTQSLSFYYLFVLSATILALIGSICYTSHVRKQISTKKCVRSDQTTLSANDKKIMDPDESELETNPCILQSQIKSARHQAIVEQLTANMTEEQILHEKEIEKAQLEAILNLLKEEQDKFNVSNMEELEEQLNLYR